MCQTKIIAYISTINAETPIIRPAILKIYSFFIEKIKTIIKMLPAIVKNLIDRNIGGGF
jgi:hypothetical protein